MNVEQVKGKLYIDGEPIEVDNSWIINIQKAYDMVPEHFSMEDFYDIIWEKSIKAFDIPREVQVIIDSNDNLFISVGTPGFVSFQGQEDELYDGQRTRMKLPIVEWIHTHPFGNAYFSGTDWRTINIWKRLGMKKATVLGNRERATFEPQNGYNKRAIETYTKFKYEDSGEKLSAFEQDKQHKEKLWESGRIKVVAQLKKIKRDSNFSSLNEDDELLHKVKLADGFLAAGDKNPDSRGSLMYTLKTLMSDLPYYEGKTTDWGYGYFRQEEE